MNELSSAIADMSYAVNALEQSISALNTQMDMVAILANATSEILLDKKIVTEDELRKILTDFAAELDDHKKAAVKKAIERAESQHIINLLKSEEHGNA